MKRFIALVCVGLTAYEDYHSILDNIFLGVYEAESFNEALDKANDEWDNKEKIKSLGEWVDDYLYHIRVEEII